MEDVADVFNVGRMMETYTQHCPCFSSPAKYITEKNTRMSNIMCGSMDITEREHGRIILYYMFYIYDRCGQ